jgi:fatty acid desaturase
VFWLIQHQCAADAIDEGEEAWQPTVSYYGSDVANWLNFGELYHVEHHDFPRIPFNKIHRCRKIAPEFYDHLYASQSIFGDIKSMITSDNDNWLEKKGDFAGRERHIKSLRAYYMRKRFEAEMYSRSR